MDAAQAPGFAHQAGLTAFGYTRTYSSGGYGCLNDRLRARRPGRCKKAGFDHVPFDDVADRGDQRADIPVVSALGARSWGILDGPRPGPPRRGGKIAVRRSFPRIESAALPNDFRRPG
jgi:hypothetical protein